MEIVNPQLTQVVPLFQALHVYHAELAPGTYHCDASEVEFMTILKAACGKGGRIFAHDAGWGLVSYLLAIPEIVERDALRCGYRAVRVDHLYVSPVARGRGLGQELISCVEDWARCLGFDGWYVHYHSGNPGAAAFYASVGADPWKGHSRKRIT